MEGEGHRSLACCPPASSLWSWLALPGEASYPAALVKTLPMEGPQAVRVLNTWSSGPDPQ